MKPLRLGTFKYLLDYYTQMSLKLFWRWVKRSITMWTRINEPPEEIRIKYFKWYDNRKNRPYNETKYFSDKEYIYKVVHGAGQQGECIISGWWVKPNVN